MLYHRREKWSENQLKQFIHAARPVLETISELYRGISTVLEGFGAFQTILTDSGRF